MIDILQSRLDRGDRREETGDRTGVNIVTESTDPCDTLLSLSNI